MLIRSAFRFAHGVNNRVLWAFLRRFAWQGYLRQRQYNHDKSKGIYRPPVLFLSVTNRCNYRCQGCWVSQHGGATDMPPGLFHSIIRQARHWGNSFFGILGGEPLLYNGLWDILAEHPDCYFQVFTNGSLLTAEHAHRMKTLGNVTPLISIEGLEESSNIRRGAEMVYTSSLQALEMCRSEGLITGVATSVCKSNVDDLVSESFVKDIAARGAKYLWYYIYRPVGPTPCPELAMDIDHIIHLRKFLVEYRAHAPLLLIDSYWDAEGKAFCPAAEGMSVHINPEGYIEPCPPLQFACDRIGLDTSVTSILDDSSFLRDFCKFSLSHGRGCILMNAPEALQQFVKDYAANDTTGRDGFGELKSMRSCPCHDIPEAEYPETTWAWRMAKRNAFFGLGAYG